jgi:dTDP-4-amino-4,6-dideoxygalactose transaminase
MSKKIDFLDLKNITNLHHQQYMQVIDDVLKDGWFIIGKRLKFFEEEYAVYSQTKYALGLANGLDALILSLIALDIGTGDEVIVPSNTYIASWLAITHTDATIRPVEPRIDTYNINCDLIEAAINKKTKAIMAVNLYGQSSELTKLKAICTKHNLYLIEDNAQSQGAKCDNKMTGSFGDINATSFYPGKNIGAFGDGGAITTDNFELSNKILTLRNYGSKIKYFNDVIGYNSRLDELQAAILSIKLKYLDIENQHRVKIANLYNHLLSGIGDLILPIIAENCTSVYHIYLIRTKQRNELQDYLTSENILTMIHYPLPPHLQKAYLDLGYLKGDFPIAEEIANTCLSLPIGPHLSVIETEYICEKIKDFFNKQ